jgi:hypothetical protein
MVNAMTWFLEARHPAANVQAVDGSAACVKDEG